jgi:hypothetical protein
MEQICCRLMAREGTWEFGISANRDESAHRRQLAAQLSA